MTQRIFADGGARMRVPHPPAPAAPIPGDPAPQPSFGRVLAWSAALLAGLLVAACGDGGGPAAVHPLDGQPPVPEARVRDAVARLDDLAADLMQRSGIPGLAVAVVQGDAVLYAKGFGVRRVGAPEPVDADTVFALASMSKPIGASVVARQVTLGRARWDLPLREELPWFGLSDLAASEAVTVGDLYAHRSGLPDHAGDTLEELDFGRDAILQGLRQLPLGPFRQSFSYTNYGMTAAATAVAARAGVDWADLSEQALYRPLGMASTSSRFADFLARPNRAPGHVKEGGVFVLGPERPAGTGQLRWSKAWNTDRQSPSGGVTSSARDVARWMSFVLGVLNGGGGGSGGGAQVSAAALLPAVTPQVTIYQAQKAGEQSVHYGFGFFVTNTDAGRRLLYHGGAYAWGTGTHFALLPSANLGIVVLTNAWPTGVAEALSDQFLDLVQFGAVRQDWYAQRAAGLAGAFTPEGELAGQPAPPQPVPPQPLAAYAGTYDNPYHGAAQVVSTGEGLELRLGAQGQVVFPLRHWSGDVFTFTPFNDSAGPGSVSRADFSAGSLLLEHYHKHAQGLGIFTRARAF